MLLLLFIYSERTLGAGIWLAMTWNFASLCFWNCETKFFFQVQRNSQCMSKKFSEGNCLVLLASQITPYRKGLVGRRSCISRCITLYVCLSLSLLCTTYYWCDCAIAACKFCVYASAAARKSVTSWGPGKGQRVGAPGALTPSPPQHPQRHLILVLVCNPWCALTPIIYPPLISHHYVQQLRLAVTSAWCGEESPLLLHVASSVCTGNLKAFFTWLYIIKVFCKWKCETRHFPLVICKENISWWNCCPQYNILSHLSGPMTFGFLL